MTISVVTVGAGGRADGGQGCRAQLGGAASRAQLVQASGGAAGAEGAARAEERGEVPVLHRLRRQDAQTCRIPKSIQNVKVGQKCQGHF